MFFNAPINGDNLPDKTLCLTYDDGPGPNTLELAQYLFENGIPATFFVLGERFHDKPDILTALQNLGHLVANHTYSHPNLVEVADSPPAFVSQIVQTDLLLKHQLGLEVTLFRPPYGSWWRAGQRQSPVAKALNLEERLARCVGPIMWDIDGSDWRFWRDRESTEACAQQYLDLIESAGRGIVLMHDSSWESDILQGNQSLEMNRLLIPELIRRGYRFVSLDAVPQVASAMQVTRRVAFQAVSHKYFLSLQKQTEEIAANAVEISMWEEFGLVPLNEHQVALRAPNGRFLSKQPGNKGKLLANGVYITACEIFTLIDALDQQVNFQRFDGNQFLSLENLNGGANIDVHEVFSIIDL
jgi:peptidoglycan/xylan/chitin deacetylase (PgdA/CDA1 family)